MNFPQWKTSERHLPWEKNNYINVPDIGTELKALASNNVLNDKLLNLQEIATKRKADDIINVMRYISFEYGYTNGAGIKVLTAFQQTLSCWLQF